MSPRSMMVRRAKSASWPTGWAKKASQVMTRKKFSIAKACACSCHVGARGGVYTNSPHRVRARMHQQTEVDQQWNAAEISRRCLVYTSGLQDSQE